MTRPSIVRADTLDLQDPDSPTAQDHHKHPNGPPNSNAPHLSAQLHHVLEERHSEEQALADAWSIADNLAPDPAAIEQAQANNGTTASATEHVTIGSSDGAEGADSDADADDDMMDRISSSPSIDDGGFSLHLSHTVTLRRCGPARKPSQSPLRTTSTPARDSFNQIANTYNVPESSPFSNTPQHLPLRPRVVGVDANSSSPFDQVPKDPPPRTCSLPMSKYHQTGRYEDDIHRGPDLFLDQEWNDLESGAEAIDGEDVMAHAENTDFPRTADNAYNHSPIASPFRNHSFFTSLASLAPPLEPSPSLSSINSVDLDALLLPKDDPLLDTPPSPNGSSGSWESTSESNSGGSDTIDEDYQNFDDTNDFFIDLDDRFIDSGWGGECLRETEDIDFEFVYALHTFVATVEGQANATKGDTMVLLDDSNSYWWLVRVVKDSSIGYLPAEHIETPTERLARLNKHRNIDLSATMLSDNSEKSRNPMKKAMRRRKAKTVQFAAPTYVEASDYDYSTEDEEANMIEPSHSNAVHSDHSAAEEPEVEAEDAKAEHTETHAERRSSTSSQRASFDREQAATAAQALAAAGIGNDEAAPKLVDKTGEFEPFDIDDSTPTVSTEAAPLKSKKTRNTDSFLKDDSLETRKITLTPGLLRDDSASSIKTTTSVTETMRSSSMESLTKTTSPPVVEQTKKEAKEQKKKEAKKGGMLSGLFRSKKKDKKAKEDTDAESEKVSTELQRDSPKPGSVRSGNSSPAEKSFGTIQTPARSDSQQANPTVDVGEAPKEPNNAFVAELEGSEAAYEMAASRDVDAEVASEPQRNASVDSAQQEKSKGIIGNPLSPISTVTNTVSNILKTSDDKPKKAKRSKQRVQLDDFDSPQDESGKNPFADHTDDSEEGGERLSDSPVEVSSPSAFMHGTDSIHIPTPGEGEHTFEDDEDEEPESLTSSPSIIEHPAEPPEEDDPTPTARSPQPPQPQHPSLLTTDHKPTDSSSTTSTSPSTTTAWNDESLRAWLEDGSEVRDMLVMIHDKSNVTPAAPDHPLLEGLFVEQKKGVGEMMGQLDGLLGTYLTRKGVKI